jgi:hypothetical protein
MSYCEVMRRRFFVPIMTATLAALALPRAEVLARPAMDSYGPDLTTSGNCIDGGHTGSNVCGGAFADNGITTFWQSSQTGASGVSGVAYVGQDFGSGNSYVICQFTIHQKGSQGITSVKVQGSNDGSSWDTIATVTIAADTSVNSYPVPGCSNTYRYWILLANANPGAGAPWGINELEMMALLATSTPVPGTATPTPTITNTPTATLTPTTDYYLYATTTQGAPIRLERSATFGDIGTFAGQLIMIVILLTGFAILIWQR